MRRARATSQLAAVVSDFKPSPEARARVAGLLSDVPTGQKRRFARSIRYVKEHPAPSRKAGRCRTGERNSSPREDFSRGGEKSLVRHYPYFWGKENVAHSSQNP
jgi:hypothetical protein